MYIAVEGCCHGELDTIYATLQEVERRNGIKVDALLCCGDFEAIRNQTDLGCMNVPPKYLHMGDFHKYYSGAARAPVLTIFIGGNHEAVNHLWELYYGGWAAPNIYFLGFAGCVRLGNLRIAGLSGIFNARHYHHGYSERPPYVQDDKISLYHVRHYEVFKLSLLKEPLTIVASHDWPAGVAPFGDTEALYRRKPDFQQEIESDQFGNPPARQLMETLKPVYWFAAHHHIKFAAVVPHTALHGAGPVPADLGPGNRSANRFWTPASLPPAGSPLPPTPEPATETGDAAQDSSVPPESGLSFICPASHDPDSSLRSTRFLALDKCLPSRHYLQVLHIDDDSPPDLCYDPEWLTILKLAQSHFPATERRTAAGSLRPLQEEYETQAPATRQWLERRAEEYEGGKYRGFRIPNNFQMSAAPHPSDSSAAAAAVGDSRPPWMATDNPQTRELLAFLGIPLEDNRIISRGGSGASKRPLTTEIGSVEDQVSALKRQLTALQAESDPTPAAPTAAPPPDPAALRGPPPSNPADPDTGGFFLCTCVGPCVCGSA
jgi:lariat debranching enzyme